MILQNVRGKFPNCGKRLLVILWVLPLLAGVVWAQVTATITGSVKDTSGAVVPGTAITAKNLETGLTRTAETDERGNYRFAALPVGQYEVTAEKAGFKLAVRRGLTLVVGQQAVVDLALEVGAVEQTVTVTAAAPLVNTTLATTAGLVSQQQVKDLPLNGRSYDQLLTLNAGVVDHSGNSSRNAFSVSGRRPDENRFLLNGMDYISISNGLSQNPYGSSGQVLGVEAVREFNVVDRTYGAEYGKRSGGQINILTSSGTNQLHGSVFEYLRNDLLDARNFFDVSEPPPLRRNQLGGSLGGPILRDKLFLFGAYEGFRQRLGSSGQEVVPDANARRGFLPIGPGGSLIEVPNIDRRMLGYMPFWREGNGPLLAGGAQLAIYSPVNAIREDNGQIRFDYNISPSDSLSGSYMVDDGQSGGPSSSTTNISQNQLQAKVVTLQHTRILSPTLLNMATLGYSRAYTFSTGGPTYTVPDNLRFFEGANVGTIRIGGSLISGTSTFAALSGGGRTNFNARNLYSVTDDVSYTNGPHSFKFGVWMQKNQMNPGSPPTAGDGAVNYATLTTMLQDNPTAFAGANAITVLGYRQTQAAWYAQDEIKLRPNLNLRVGLRHEMTTGYNEKSCRAANYSFDEHSIPSSEPFVGCSALTTNNAQFLFQPRVGLAWDPTGTGSWSVRAGFSIIHNLQDDLSHRLWHPPLNGVLSKPGGVPMLSYIPFGRDVQASPSCTFERTARGIPCAIYSPGIVEPTFFTPTIQQWTLTIERQLSENLMLRVGYIGSQDYHMPTNMHVNQPFTQVCNNAAGCSGGGVGTAAGLVPQGKEYIPGPRAPYLNPNLSSTYSWFFNGTSNYQALDFTVQKRMSSGFSFRTNYTFSKNMDITSGIALSLNSNAQQIVNNRYNLRLARGVAAFNLKNQFNANFSYELPFGAGKPWGSGATGFLDKLISGWQLNGITSLQGGFPFSPLVGRNISGSGDTRNSDATDMNPNFTGDVILGTAERWYDPNAFAVPIPGTFGNAGRGSVRGPGLFNVDASLFKTTLIGERYRLQFRFEAFNVLNHTNLGNPNAGTFSGAAISPTAGRITSTRNRPRNLQFALRFSF